MPRLHQQLNRRKSQAPPPTQPSLIFKKFTTVALLVEPDFKDLRRLSCRWSPTFTTVALLVEPDLNELKYELYWRLTTVVEVARWSWNFNDGRGSFTTVPTLKLSNATVVKVGLH